MTTTKVSVNLTPELLERAEKLASRLTDITGVTWNRSDVIRRALARFEPDELAYAAAEGPEEVYDGTD